MTNNHSTAQCPACNRDTGCSDYAAFVSVITCPWCNAKFKWDDKTKSLKVISEE